MINQVLIDTGPIVAILSKSDHYHTACTEALKVLKPPLLTTWPVLTEALWLLRKDTSAIEQLFRAFRFGLYKLVDLDFACLAAIEQFMKRYRKLGPQLADASLVCLGEIVHTDRIFTLDQRDFSVYRDKDNRSFKLIELTN